jgi:hypothetical protein
MINIPHIDLKIWQAEHKAVEIIKELQSRGSVTLAIDNEGSDCKTLGLYKLLDNICDRLGYDRKNITIHTCNQLEQHPDYCIIKSAPLYISSGQQFSSANAIPEKNWDTIKHFGIFIGRSSWQRLWMASYIWNNFKENAEITYHHNSSVDYHREHLSFDQLSVQIGLKEATDCSASFMRHLPIINQQVDIYPILTPAHFAISKLYPNFFMEIVCETFLTGDSFYPTEKTWRPFICRTPFIALGPRNYLSNLKKLGFRTFGQWWDESYDQDVDLDNGKVSIRNIQRTLKRLGSLTKEELEAMYIDMQPTLDHNYNTFMNLTEQEFTKIWP